jgi:hypothetical protein
MARMKAYTLGINGFVGSIIADMIGEPAHTRQAYVLIVAPTKAAAADLAASYREWGVFAPRLSDPEFRVVSDSVSRQLLEAAGDAPGVFVHPLTTHHSAPVVALGDDGPHQVGRLERNDGPGYTFIPDGEG